MASRPRPWPSAGPKKGTRSTHPIRGGEMRALRKLQREQDPKSKFVFTSELGDTLRGLCRPISAIRTSKTPCVTPSLRRHGSRTSRVNRKAAPLPRCRERGPTMTLRFHWCIPDHPMNRVSADRWASPQAERLRPHLTALRLLRKESATIRNRKVQARIHLIGAA